MLARVISAAAADGFGGVAFALTMAFIGTVCGIVTKAPRERSVAMIWLGSGVLGFLVAALIAGLPWPVLLLFWPLGPGIGFWTAGTASDGLAAIFAMLGTVVLAWAASYRMSGYWRFLGLGVAIPVIWPLFALLPFLRGTALETVAARGLAGLQAFAARSGL